MPVIGEVEPREGTRYSEVVGKLREALRRPEAVNFMTARESDPVGFPPSIELRSHCEVLWALTQLPWTQRRPIELIHGPDDLSQREAAAQLGISERQLRSLVSDGIDKMIRLIYC